MKASKFQRDKSPEVLRHQDLANGEEAIVRIPVVVEPIEVQVPLGIVPVEVRNVTVAINLTNGALCEKAIHATAPRLLHRSCIEFVI